MNSKNIKALENECICMKCLKKEATKFYNIYGRGYGSIFDSFNSKLQFCNDCDKEEYEIWANEENEWDDNNFYTGEEYQYEDNLKQLIDSLPLEGRELFYNRFSHGACACRTMEPQDWIDYELDELPHERCKEYGIYSPEEITAYKERFPNCICVFIKKYSDNSKCSQCPFGAFGDEEGNAGSNISAECYMCDNYHPREGDVKIIDERKGYYENEKLRLLHMKKYAEERLVKIEIAQKEYQERNAKKEE